MTSRLQVLVLWPLVLYGAGGGADIASTRSTPPGYHRVDASPFGPVAGPVVTSAAFAGADALLQSHHHHGWAWVLRGAYAVGVTALVVHNRQAGRDLPSSTPR